MTKSTITRERLAKIKSWRETYGAGSSVMLPAEEAEELARMALAAMDSESGCLPLDYLQGHKDGLEWAARLAEANHPETGDWLYDDPIELAKAIRKGPDMPPAQSVADSEPVIVVGDDGGDALSYRRLIQSFEPGTKLYLHAQPAPVVPKNCVTAEHRRVIEMLLTVCGAAFELADDSCQQDFDGEECHVVPGDAFQRLSDALDEIENTLPTEDTDRSDVFLVWSAVPRAALKSILHAQPALVVEREPIAWLNDAYLARGVDDGEAGSEDAGPGYIPVYRHAQPAPIVPEEWTIADAVKFCKETGRQDAGAAMDAWNACRAAMLQENPVCTCPSGDGSLRWPCPVHPGSSPVIPDGWTCNDKANAALMMLDRIETADPVDDDRIDGIKRIVRELVAAKQPQNAPQNIPEIIPGWIPVSERIPDNTEPVLCIEKRADFGTYGQPFVCWHDGGGWVGKTNYRPIVTHWMPLPAGPQEVR